MPVNRKHFLAGGLFLALLLVWWVLRPVVVTEIVSDELPARDQDMLPEAKVAERFRHVRINASAVEADLEPHEELGFLEVAALEEEAAAAAEDEVAALEEEAAAAAEDEVAEMG